MHMVLEVVAGRALQLVGVLDICRTSCAYDCICSAVGRFDISESRSVHMRVPFPLSREPGECHCKRQQAMHSTDQFGTGTSICAALSRQGLLFHLKACNGASCKLLEGLRMLHT